MKIAAHLARHRRLAGLVVLSLLLHLLAFAWLDGRLAQRRPPQAGLALALRLAPAAPPVPLPAGGEPSAPSAAPARQAAQALPPASAPLNAPASAPPASAAGAGTPPATPEAGRAPAAAANQVPIQMPGRYQVRPPPSVRLGYTVTRAQPGQPAGPSASARIVWELGNGSYRLRVEGVLGQLESEGGEDDAGIAPVRAAEHGPAGAELTVRFDRAAQRIDVGLWGNGAPLHTGSQDRASVLIQLAGIGLAEPDQMQDAIEIVVAGAGGVGITRFEVLGHEELATGVGRLDTVRLAQSAGAGERRIDVWLAPGRNWLPVQLRVTEPDGTVANQLLTDIDTETAAPPAM